MRILFICCFVLSSLYGMAGVFDVLRLLPVKDRMAKAQAVYNKEVRYKDSATAIRSLNELAVLAKDLGDQLLQCLSVSLLADQYARMRRANELSTRLHQEAIAMAEKFELPLMVGICTYRLGRYYYNFKNYPYAFEYMLRADNIFRELGYKEVPDIDEILFFIGSIYYETGDYEKAEAFLQKVLVMQTPGAYVHKQSLNTLALIRRQQGDTTHALLYFQKTLAVSIAQNHSTWMAICYSNIGTLYFYQGKYAKSYPLLQQSCRLGYQYKLWGDVHSSLHLMARMDLIQGRLHAVQQKIDSAAALRPVFFTPAGRKQEYETQVLLYEHTGQQAKALEVQHRLLLVKDSLSVSKDQQGYKRILLRMETERHLNDIDKLEAETASSFVKRNAVIVVLALLLVVVLLLYNRSRLKANNRAAVLEAEKMRAEEQLKSARQLLQNFTENTRRKNELIEHFSAELERLRTNLAGDPLYEERLRNFDKLIHSTILTDAEWIGFRELFDKVHKGFLVRLQKKLPGLSLNDIRLVSLVKLGLGSLEMGRMMGMDEESVARAKQRLREKIHPGQDGLLLDDLVHAI